MTETETQCKLLEKEVCAREETSKRLSEEIVEKTEEVKENNSRISSLLEEADVVKAKYQDEKMAMQSDADAKLKEQQLMLEDAVNDHRVALNETKLKFSNERGGYQQEISDLRDLTSKQKEELEAKMEMISENEKSIIKRSEELESSLKTCSCLQETIANLQEENQELKKDVEKNSIANAEIERCRQQIVKLENQLNNLKMEKQMLDEQLVNMKTSKDEESSSFMKQNMQYMNQISTMLKQINEQSSRNDVLNEKVATLEEKVKTQETELEVSAVQSANELKAKSSENESCLSTIAALEAEKLAHHEEIRLCNEKIEMLEERYKKDTSRLTEEVKNAQAIVEQKDLLIGTYGDENKDLSADMERKDEEIRELERRLAAEEVDNLQLRETNRSLDIQVQTLHASVNDLNVKLSSCKENMNVSQYPFPEDTLHHAFGEQQMTRRQTYAVVDSRRQTFAVEQPYNSLQQQQNKFAPMHTIPQSPDASFNTTVPLSMEDLNKTKTPDRRSILSLPLMKEEDEHDGDSSFLSDSDSLRRTFSLRETKAERRRSFQPHRYMAGSSPPDRRTSAFGDKSYLNMAAFATEAEEPEQLDDMEWNKIARLKETMKNEDKNLCDDEKNRLAELQRRNTLCLPHLRSAYPMELQVSRNNSGEEEAGLETTIREGVDTSMTTTTTRKKGNDATAMNDSFNLKRKHNDEQDSMSKFKKTKRLVVPPPVVELKNEPSASIDDTNVESKPVAKPAESFEIAFSPPKSSKPPRMTRAHASAHLLKSKEVKSTSDLPSGAKKSPVTKKSSSTGGLKKSIVTKKPLQVGAADRGSNRRLTQTLRKANTELKNQVGVKKSLTNKKPLNEVKDSTSNTTKTSSKSASTSGKTATTGEKFSRSDSKRSSFSKAKTRVAASLRGKK